jgi:hypothetical protein
MWDADDVLWVADTGNRRVLRYRLPDPEPQLVIPLDGPVVGIARAGDRLAVAVPVAGQVVLLDPDDGARTGGLDVPGWAEGLQQEGYLAALADGTLLASAPHPGELWRVDPDGEPPRRVRDGLTGLTAIAVGPGGEVLGSLTWEHRLVRLGSFASGG